MQSSEHIAALIAQHVPAPRRRGTLPGPGPSAPPPLPRMHALNARQALAQAVDVTAYAIDDEEGGRSSFLSKAWFKCRSQLQQLLRSRQLRWASQLGRLSREARVRLGIAVVSLALGLLIGVRPWQSSTASSKARLTQVHGHRTRPVARLATRAAPTTARALAALPVEDEGTRTLEPVRINASSQRSSKADARADKRKVSAKHRVGAHR